MPLQSSNASPPFSAPRGRLTDGAHKMDVATVAAMYGNRFRRRGGSAPAPDKSRLLIRPLRMSDGPAPLRPEPFAQFRSREPQAIFIRTLPKRQAIDARPETNSRSVTWSGVTHGMQRQEAELVMNSRTSDDSERIDCRTSRAICEAVAERLQQSLRPEPSRLSSQLEHLMDELRRRD